MPPGRAAAFPGNTPGSTGRDRHSSDSRGSDRAGFLPLQVAPYRLCPACSHPAKRRWGQPQTRVVLISQLSPCWPLPAIFRTQLFVSRDIIMSCPFRKDYKPFTIRRINEGDPAMVRLNFAIELKYEIVGKASDFIFNVHAAHTRCQSVVTEHLYISQRVLPVIYTDPTYGTRYMRLKADPGQLRSEE